MFSTQEEKKGEEKPHRCIMKISVNTEEISSGKEKKKKKMKREIRDSSRNKNVQSDKYF